MAFINAHVFPNREAFDTAHGDLIEQELGKGVTLNYVEGVELPDGRVYCLPYEKTTQYFGPTERIEIPDPKDQL